MIDVPTGMLVRPPTIGHVVSVSYAADGGTIASGGGGGRVSLWDGHSRAPLSSVTVGRPGTAAYVGSTPTATRCQSRPGTARSTSSTAASPTGASSLVALRTDASDTDSQITVFDVETGQVDRVLSLPSYPFAVSPDGATIAAAADDGSVGTDVVLADAATGQPTSRLRGHTGAVLDIAFSSDGTEVASSSADRSVIVWDVDSGEPLRQFRGHASAVPSVAFEPESPTVLSAGADRSILRWDLSGDRQFIPLHASTAPLRTNPAFVQFAPSSVPSPDGSAVAYVSFDVSETNSTRVTLQVLDTDRRRTSDPVDALSSTAVSWHPDGDRFASTGADGFVRVWDRRAVEVSAERRLGLSGAGVAYLPSGDELVITGDDGFVQRLDAESLENRDRPFLLPGVEFDQEPGLVASGDGRTVAALVHAADGEIGTGSDPDDRLLLIDVVAREARVDVALGFEGAQAAFSPDGGRVAVAGRRGQVAVFDAATGDEIRRPTIGHDGTVVTISYAADGVMIASGGQDGRVALWDGQTGALLSSVPVGRPDAAVFVAFTPDGQTVSVITVDGEAYELDTRAASWIEFACFTAGRNLTRTEWRDAFGDRPYRETCS